MPDWLKVERVDEGDGRPAGGSDGGASPDGRAGAAGGPVPLRSLLAVAAVALVAGLGLWLGRGLIGGPVAVGPGGAAGGAEGTGAAAPGDVLATVGDTQLTSADVDLEVKMQVAIRNLMGMQLTEDPSTQSSFRREVLAQLVDQRLLRLRANDAGIVIDDAALEAELPVLGQNLGLSIAAIEQQALAVGVDAPAFQEWARGQATMSTYMRSPDAEALKVRIPNAGFRPVQPGELAELLYDDYDVAYTVDGQLRRTVQVGAPAPDFELPQADGSTLRLSDLRGRAVMVNFWATWCAPCRIEMPLFINAYERNKDDLVVLGVNVGETPEQVSTYARAMGLTFPIVLDADEQVASFYRVRGLPTTFFVDADGMVVEAHRGALKSRPELMPLLTRILPDASS